METNIVSKNSNTTKRHPQQRSTTLMRRAVKRPGSSLKRHIRVQVHTGTLIDQPMAAITPKLSVSGLDAARLKHAASIKRSSLIKHFSANGRTYSVSVSVESPAEQTVHSVATAPSAPAGAPPAPLPKARKHTDATGDMFERAMQHATSHLEPPAKPAKKHRFSLHRRHKHAGA